MIKEVTMYTVICDNCGKDAFDGHEYAGFNDASYALDVATDEGFEEINDGHYCQDCYEYNDEDELVVKHPQILQK